MTPQDGQQLGHEHRSQRLERLLCRRHHRAIHIGREAKAMHVLGGYQQQGGLCRVVARIVDGDLATPTAQVQHLDETVMGMRPNIVVIRARTHMDALKLKGIDPPILRLITVQIVVGNGSFHQG